MGSRGPSLSRDMAILLPIIKKYIAPGTIIMSDCLKADDCLEEHGYWHLNVNHSKNFKDPETSAHTNTIEGSWLHAKRSLPVHGWRKDLMIGYLALFLWRRAVKRARQDPFEEFLKLI